MKDDYLLFAQEKMRVIGRSVVVRMVKNGHGEVEEMRVQSTGVYKEERERERDLYSRSRLKTRQTRDGMRQFGRNANDRCGISSSSSVVM